MMRMYQACPKLLGKGLMKMFTTADASEEVAMVMGP